MHLWTREGNDEALAHFYRAIEIDPKFAAALGLAARCYVYRRASFWNNEREMQEAVRVARRADELGPGDAVALCNAGFALTDIALDFDGGDAVVERALTLNPNLAWAWQCSSWSKCSLGEPEIALKRVARAMRLSPQDPQIVSM